jgi:cardiolipin synthase
MCACKPNSSFTYPRGPVSPHRRPETDARSLRSGPQLPLRAAGEARSRVKAYALILTAAVTGCVALPTLSEFKHDLPGTPDPPVIIGPGGELPAPARRALLAHLTREAEPTEILGRHLRFMEAIGADPLTTGNKATLLVDGPSTYAAMQAAIARAKDHINVEFYIFDDDQVGRRFAELLLKRQAEGVQVNIIYDSVGSVDTPAAFFQRLRDRGIKVLEFNPIDPLDIRRDWVLTRRDHRKILVVDGKTAFTGGTNISHVYSVTRFLKRSTRPGQLPWRDTNVEIEGPAVAELQKLFLATWEQQGGPPLPKRDYCPRLEARGNDLVRIIGSKPGEKNRTTYLMYLSAIRSARTSIHLTSAYFVPDHRTLKALKEASARGVDVKLILPGVSDDAFALYAGQSHFWGLLEAGVQIYQRNHALLHAKTAEIDGIWSTVGSTNLDLWSFSRNNEVNAAIISPDFAAQMEAMFAADLAQSSQVTLEQWAKRPLGERLKEWLARAVGYWL